MQGLFELIRRPKMMPWALLAGMLCLLMPTLALGEVGVLVENTSPILLGPTTKQVRILVRMIGEAVPDVKTTPVVEAVVRGSASKSPAKFQAQWSGVQTPSAFDLTLDESQIIESGIYDVYLQVPVITGNDKHIALVRTKIQVQKAAPKIGAISKIVINRTRYFCWSEEAPSLTIQEVGKASNLTITAIHQLGQPAVGSDTRDGTVVFTPPTAQIVAGGLAEMKLQTCGSFPLGQSTVSARIDAAETTESAATVDFVINSKWHWMWIVPPVLLGLILSYIIKVILQSRIEVSEARVAALDLIDEVEAWEARHRDANFRASYATELQSLKSAVQRARGSAINEATKKLSDLWRASLLDLSKRKQAAQEDLAKLIQLTDFPWAVPPQMQSALAVLGSDIKQAATALNLDDVTMFESARARALAKFAQAVSEAVTKWQTGAKQFLDDLAIGPQGLSAAIKASIAKSAQDAAAIMKPISPADSLDSAQKISDVLTAARGERSTFRQVLENFRIAIDWELAQLRHLIAQFPVEVIPTAFDSVFEKSTQMKGFLSTATDGVDLVSFRNLSMETGESWDQALKAAFGKLDQRIETLAKNGEYLQAVAAAIQLATPVAQAEILDDAAPKPHDTAHISYVLIPPLPGVTLPQDLPLVTANSPLHPTFFQVESLPHPVPLRKATAVKTLMWQKASQSLLVALLVLIGAVATQIGTFVGSVSDFSTLIFWAFGLDLTFDAIQKIGRKIS